MHLSEEGWKPNPIKNLHNIEPKVKLSIVLVPKRNLLFDLEVRMPIGVDDSEFTGLEDCFEVKSAPRRCDCGLTAVLDSHVQQEEMIQLHGMDGHDTPFPEIAFPILIRILVVDPVFNVVWKQIFELNRRPKLEVDLGVLPKKAEDE